VKLADLNPVFFSCGGAGITVAATGEPVPLREGVGIIFDCPCGCGELIGLSFRVGLDGQPFESGHPSWERTGDTFETLTLRPSVLRTAGCRWHGFITNGEATSV
jgi:hypothetical protein